MYFNKLLRVTLFLLLSSSFLMIQCDDSDTTGTDIETGTMEVLLHDAPADYDAVNVIVERVEINNTNADTGWVVLSTPQDTYDLLELTNGNTEVIASTPLPTGMYEQIRLILSREGNNVVIDGNSYDLFIPSGTQTGIKIRVDAIVEPDITYSLLLDFDVARSVVERGNAQSGVEYLLKPVIKGTHQAITGNISGTVDPAESRPYVYAIAGSDTVSSTKADTTNGSFTLIGLTEDTYTVSVAPTDTTYQAADTSGVEVIVGQTNDLGTIPLNQ